MIGLITTSLQTLLNSQSRTSNSKLNFGFGIATEIVQANGPYYIDLQKFASVLDQVLLYTNILRTEVSD